jgi:hypothetical protein
VGVGVGGSNACFATLEQNPERRYSGWSLWMCVCVCERERELRR